MEKYLFMENCEKIMPNNISNGDPHFFLLNSGIEISILNIEQARCWVRCGSNQNPFTAMRNERRIQSENKKDVLVFTSA